MITYAQLQMVRLLADIAALGTPLVLGMLVYLHLAKYEAALDAVDHLRSFGP